MGVREGSKSTLCLIEHTAEEERFPNAVDLTLAWGTTVVARRTLTRSTSRPLAALGVDAGDDVTMQIDVARDGVTLHTPSGTKVPEGARVRLAIDDALVLVCEPVQVDAHRVLRSMWPDSRSACLALALLFVFPLASTALGAGPKSSTADDAEAAYERLTFVRSALAAADARIPEPELPEGNAIAPSDGARAKDSGGGGARAKGEEGLKGDVAARSDSARFRLELHPIVEESRAEAIEEARTFGVISIANAFDDKTAHASAFSLFDEREARGNISASAFGDAFGAGSSGLSGVGEGGGGKADVIGLGAVGTIGHGAGRDLGENLDRSGAMGTCGDDCTGSGQGFGKAHGRLEMREHRVRTVWYGGGDAMKINGRLPAETIQRIVRQNQGRMRACYERGLEGNPQLRGRVAVKFVIDRSGAVSFAADAGSDLPDQKVVDCVIAQYMNLSFPQPEGGIVTVVYPVIFDVAT